MKDATQENLNEEAALDTVQSVEDNGPELLQNDVLNLETVQTGLETKFGSERTVDTAAGNKSLKNQLFQKAEQPVIQIAIQLKTKYLSGKKHAVLVIRSSLRQMLLIQLILRIHLQQASV